MYAGPVRISGTSGATGRGKDKKIKANLSVSLDCREDPTRTDDPYVPNVVRYQLRYFSIAGIPDFSFFKGPLGFRSPDLSAAYASLLM